MTKFEATEIDRNTYAPLSDAGNRAPDGFDLTDETIAIASALYWSWWRAEEMHGRVHVEETP